MATTKKSSLTKMDNLDKLIQEAKKQEQEVQKVKSVEDLAAVKTDSTEDDQTTLVTQKTASEATESETETETKQVTTEIEVIEPGKKEFSVFLKRREDRDFETVKIPRDLHGELKVLSAATKIPMKELLANIIEECFQEYKKEIIPLKKKYVNSILGK